MFPDRRPIHEWKIRKIDQSPFSLDLSRDRHDFPTGDFTTVFRSYHRGKELSPLESMDVGNLNPHRTFTLYDNRPNFHTRYLLRRRLSQLWRACKYVQ